VLVAERESGIRHESPTIAPHWCGSTARERAVKARNWTRWMPPRLRFAAIHRTSLLTMDSRIAHWRSVCQAICAATCPCGNRSMAQSTRRIAGRVPSVGRAMQAAALAVHPSLPGAGRVSSGD